MLQDRAEGRSIGDLLAAEYGNVLACIRCGLCHSVCPTYQLTRLEAESPRGRLAMARALVEGHLEVTPDLLQHELSCLLCEACTAICPSGVRMEELGVPLRATLETHLRRPWWQRALRGLAFDHLFADMERFRQFARLLRWYQRSGLAWLARRTRALRLLGLAEAEGMLPPIDRQFLVPRGQVWPAEGGPAQARVALFAGCIMSTAFASTDRATARLLAQSGCEVVAVRGQGCCGALHAHSGDRDGARRLARQNVDAFEPERCDAVASNAAGCGAMLKEYDHLLADDPAYAERAAAFSARVRDVTQLLAERPPRGTPRELQRKAVYQEPCHLAHAQRVSAQPRALLRCLPGLTLLELPEATLCCGSAGVYNLTHPETSRALLQRKVAHILASGADLVVTANPGCLLQLQAGLREAGAQVEVRHIVDVLAEAYGLAVYTS
ncbi:MAG: 4Fe-4S dicluster domain-containing protein [Chloroflexi bacterium]|nr:4Fe-4S dicluster domain-containing protein [Chloroflexota bacterium]